MKRTNLVTVEGEIDSVTFSQTEKKQELCASFMLFIDKSKDLWNKVRVNAYGDAAKVCQERSLTKGLHVVVIGEIMTRAQQYDERKTYLTEIRLLRVHVITA